MQKKAFDILETAEGSWWDLGRQAAISAILRGNFKDVLDYGAGFGSQLPFLKKYGERIFGYEPEPSLQKKLEERGYSKVYSDKKEALSRSYELIMFLDVIEHIEDDKGAAKELFSSLNDGGTMIVTTSAYQWLWSEHDERNMHFRRYTASSFKEVLKSAGFKVEYVGYWNMALLIPLGIVRLLGGTGEGGFEFPRFVNYIIVAWLRCEAFVMKFFPLPFGVSLLARVKKE